MRQRVVGLSWGQRALVVGGLHPRLFIGTAQHTAHRATPYTRLALTARLMETVFLGTKEEADRALAFTAKRHVPVEGTMGVDGGPAHPAGAHYSAADPGLMWWTAAFALDSVEFMYDALVRPLRPHEREELFDGFVTWARLFGMPGSAAPASYPDFRRRFDAWLFSDEPHLVDEARLVGRNIAGTSGYHLPGGAPTSETLRTVVQGSLPPLVRDHYGIPWSAAHERRWLAVRTASRLAHGRLSLLGPTPFLRGKSESFYKVVQRGEQSLVRRGGVSIPGVSDITPA